MNRVFVSYSRRNKTFTERLARDLDDAGMQVWVDWRQIHAGEFWQDEIFRGIERADILVATLSPDAAKSEWVTREILTAREQNKVIIPVMAVDAYQDIKDNPKLNWILNIHFINFESRYEEALVELLDALPGKRPVGVYDIVDEQNIPNPFKGLEAFQQTDANFFFGREELIEKSLNRLRQERPVNFLAVVGASGSGKSSLVRAGILPKIRAGALPNSDQWRIAIFTPGAAPTNALSQRLAPLTEGLDSAQLTNLLHQQPERFGDVIRGTLQDAAPEARLLLVIDQFEEVFTRAGEAERELFLELVYSAAVDTSVPTQVLITMRADFFDRLSQQPQLAELFEQENMVIATEMTPEQLIRTIEGPATAVGLAYERGLPERILQDVSRQPGSLPLLQYALSELFARRNGKYLTFDAYNTIGGVQGALAQRAEEIHNQLSIAQQAIMRRVMLRLIEVSDTGEATRRKVTRNDLQFRDVPDEAVQEVIDRLTAADARLLIASREIKASSDESAPTVLIEVAHEALIRRWDRFNGWVADNMESLRFSSELLQSASDWRQSNQDVSYLLRGNRLVRAETWLENADATKLQREFIQASVEESERQEQLRQQQLRRVLRLQRLAVAVLILLLVVAVGAILAVTQSLEAAEDARDAADIARDNANSNALAADASRALSDNDLDEALLLAISANQATDSPSPSVQRVLSEVAYAPGTRYIFDPELDAIEATDISPDGRLFVAATGEMLIFVELATGTEVLRIANSEIGHSNTITDVQFMPEITTEGARLMSADQDGLILLHDVNTGAVLARYAGVHTSQVNAIALNDTAERMASVGRDGQLVLWDVATQVPLWTGQHVDDDGDPIPVNAVAFDNDAPQSAEDTDVAKILTGADDGTGYLWIEETGDPFLVTRLTDNGAQLSVWQKLEGHDSPITSVAFSPTSPDIALTAAGSPLGSTSTSNTVRMWNVESGAQADAFTGHADVINAVAFETDGETFISASSDETLIRWNATTGELLTTYSGHESGVNGLAITPDTLHMVSASEDGTLRLWEVERAEEIARYVGHQDSQSVVAVYGPDNETVLSGSFDETIRLWSVADQNVLQELRGHTGRVADVDISNDGTQALSASWDQSVILWDIYTATVNHTLTGHQDAVQTVTFSADNTQAVSGSSNGDLILWDLQSGALIRQYGPVDKDQPGHEAGNSIFDVDITPDGSRLISASRDETLVLWDTATGEVLATLEGHDAQVRAVAFNSSGLQAVSGALNGSVHLWDVDPASETFGQIIREFEGHRFAVFDVAFSPDNNSVLSGSFDGTLRLWDITSGFELRRYNTDPNGTARVRSVDFSNDGETVLTGMTDSTIREWRLLVQLEDLIGWTLANRYVETPDCNDQSLSDLVPICDEDGNPFLNDDVAEFQTTKLENNFLPVTNAPATVNLTIGAQGQLNTLSLRAEPSLTGAIIERLEDDTVVTVLDGPQIGDDYRWWYVLTPSGVEGWAAESEPTDNLQLLVNFPNG